MTRNQSFFGFSKIQIYVLNCFSAPPIIIFPTTVHIIIKKEIDKNYRACALTKKPLNALRARASTRWPRTIHFAALTIFSSAFYT